MSEGMTLSYASRPLRALWREETLRHLLHGVLAIITKSTSHHSNRLTKQIQPTLYEAFET